MAVMETREVVRQSVAAAERLLLSEPAAALTAARKAVEGILIEVYEQVNGGSGTRPKLEDLLRKLSADRAIPVQIEVPIRTVQAYGNYASHASSADVTAEYARPAILALQWVNRWYLYSSPASAPVERTADEPPGSTEEDPRLRSLCIQAAVNGLTVAELADRAARAGFDHSLVQEILDRLRGSGLIAVDSNQGDQAKIALRVS